MEQWLEQEQILSNAYIVIYVIIALIVGFLLGVVVGEM